MGSNYAVTVKVDAIRMRQVGKRDVVCRRDLIVVASDTSCVRCWRARIVAGGISCVRRGFMVAAVEIDERRATGGATELFDHWPDDSSLIEGRVVI